MQQRSQYPSHTVSLFGSSSLAEIPHMYSWFEEMRAQHPTFYDERTRLWQAFRHQDVLSILTDYNRFSSQAFGVAGSFLKDTLREGPTGPPQIAQPGQSGIYATSSCEPVRACHPTDTGAIG
ncbi:MAG: hypothetical protein ABI324_20800 [Ktedonobacteraceae bacterium]